MSDSHVEGWWQAKDSRWYPPEMHPSVTDGPLAPPLGWVRREDGSWAPPDPSHQPDPDDPVTVSVVRVGHSPRRRGRVLALFVVALLALAGGAYAVAGKSNKEPTVDVRDETTIRRPTTTEGSTTTTVDTTTTVPDTTTSIDWTAVGALAAAQASSSTTTTRPVVRRRAAATTTTVKPFAGFPPATPATFPPPTVPDTTTPTDPVTTAPAPTDTTPDSIAPLPN